MQKSLRKDLERARFLTKLLDTKFNFLGINFGIDPILNLIPGMGNIIGSLTSMYLLWIALRLNLSKGVYFHMLGNILIDFVFGSIPVAGAIADIFYKSNYRNLKLIEESLNTINRS